MKFTELVGQVRSWLEREQRVTYRTLQREFDLDVETLADLREELIEAKRVAIDENGKVLVWTGGEGTGAPEKRRAENLPPTPNTQPLSAERRQLTVLFCDLVGSTALSTQLDPEDLRSVVRQYQQTCAEMIQRHDGYIAQYLGDGVLVYFGYPTAHEDDARRAVRTGLEIIEAIRGQVTGDGGPSGRQSLQVRIGIHTGLVVIGDIGTSGRTEQLALGETPNIAARIQGLADPNTVIISAATQRLIDGQFESQPFGSQLLKGIDIPIAVYHIQSERQHASPLAGRTTLTPLIGREQEVGLLLDRWEQAKEGRGQVVLLSGEPGIGKSRLALTLREHVTSEGSLLFEARCSPYHQHSAFYPLIEAMQRTLLFTRQDTDREKVEKLDRALALYNLQDTLPLFTALLSLPAPGSPLPALSPQKQKERTLQALLQLMVAQAERQATVSVWEDLHWADPSSLEFLSLLIEQIPTTNLLLVLTFRPEFVPPWKPRSHISQLVLNRLGKKQVEAMIAQVTEQKDLAAEVIEQIRVKTDGVPLFVEELTKSVVESTGGHGRASLQMLAIPATLQEALLARLDRLSTARQVAQLGATLGREFSHELIQAVTPLSEVDLHAALEKLVEAEILYQRGSGEQARYFFKHALIQDTAYQSLLKSTRQHYHQQIAQVLEERFPDTKEKQPELLAHHYTEANLIEQAIPYWQQAGERAVTHSAYIEAENYFTQALAFLQTLPESRERLQQEVHLQTRLVSIFVIRKGVSAPEVGESLTRASEICQQLADPIQLFIVLAGLRGYWSTRGEVRRALVDAEQMLQIAQQLQDPGILLQAHMSLGLCHYTLGALTLAREHLEQGIAYYDPQQHHSLTLLYGYDPKVLSLGYSSFLDWSLGYPQQALQKAQQGLTLARELGRPVNVAIAVVFSGWTLIHRQESQKALERLPEATKLSTEHGFPNFLTLAMLLQGRSLLRKDNSSKGLELIEESLALMMSMKVGMFKSEFLAYQAEGYEVLGHVETGLSTLALALEFVEKNDERYYEAELYRLRGELTLAQSSVQRLESSVQKEAEECFLKAIDIAQQQQAKSWELRASTSLARLWQSQGKKADAHKLLSEVYNWFTEGFDTKDLQEAQALLDELAQG